METIVKYLANAELFIALIVYNVCSWDKGTIITEKQKKKKILMMLE